MASFTGTQSKCKACAKTVYPMEQLTANGIIFHRACFRCAHCKATISLNSFAAIEGVPYCKPHFEQLFKQTGSYTRSFEGAIKAEKDATPPPESLTPSAVVKATEKRSTPSPLALKFGGTQDKCKVCSKTVYPLEKISVEGVTYHKQCFRCVHSNCSLTTSNYAALNGSLYCKHHYNQLFLVKGTYSNINKSAAVAAALGVPAEESAAAPADGLAPSLARFHAPPNVSQPSPPFPSRPSTSTHPDPSRRSPSLSCQVCFVLAVSWLTLHSTLLLSSLLPPWLDPLMVLLPATRLMTWRWR
ncbi:unnamed protein product [Closterium sp. Naga37s-1]|nr:unnamed protein product [Closterium sp. Naga37s-1]